MEARELSMVPTDRLRPIVEAWIATRENPEQAFHELAAASPFKADSWRKKLTGEGKYSLWRFIEIDFDDADALLTAAGLTHVWQAELRDLLPEPRLSDEDFDATCAECGRWIDWSRGDAGVRVEIKQPRRWTLWWSLCALCFARSHPPAHPADATGRIPTPRIPDGELLSLYERYLHDEIGLQMLADRVYERYGFASSRSCFTAITHAWRKAGWPLRDRTTSKRLNGKHRYRKLGGRIPEADLRKLHVVHTKGMVSIRQLARQVAGRYGYRSFHSCEAAISASFKALGLQAVDRIAMTVHASTTNGLSPRDWQERRRRRLEAGLTSKGKQRRRCGATVKRSGKPCERPPILGCDYCVSHDPRRQEAQAARLAAMRERSPIHNPLRVEPVEPLQEELLAHFAWAGGWALLAEATGRERAWLSKLARDKKRKRVSRRWAAEIREAIRAIEAPDLAAAA